jgi:outer membrane protein TolC
MRFFPVYGRLMDVVRRHAASDKSDMLRVADLGRTATAVFLLIQTTATPARADTMEAALLRAYQNNPQLNAQRASVRATDENVPQALSGYRPKATVTASGGGQYSNQLVTSNGKKVQQGPQGPHAVGASVTQTLFNGNQTANKTRAAESQVMGAREALRLLEQTVLLSAATVYMDFLRDGAILEVQRSNTRVLEQTLKQTRDRYNAGLVTPTDVAQSEAQLAAGQTQELAAEANLNTTRANFRRIIGNAPSQLAPASPVDRYLPETLRDQRRRAVSDRDGAGQRAEDLAADHYADMAIQCFGSGPGEHTDLPGWSGVLVDTAVEGNAGTAALESGAGS